jgi:hypothetical protein
VRVQGGTGRSERYTSATDRVILVVSLVCRGVVKCGKKARIDFYGHSSFEHVIRAAESATIAF